MATGNSSKRYYYDWWIQARLSLESTPKNKVTSIKQKKRKRQNPPWNLEGKINFSESYKQIEGYDFFPKTKKEQITKLVPVICTISQFGP